MRPQTAEDLAVGARTVSRFMTPSRCSIGPRASLDAAHALMLAHKVRHLPVLDGGKVAGILSWPDPSAAESVADIDPSAGRVDDAMSLATCVVRPDTPVDEVVLDLADRMYRCAVVMDGATVVGVFTTADALRALSHLRQEPGPAR